MSAAKISNVHAAEPNGVDAPVECRADAVIRRELDRRAWGEILGSAIESAGASVLAVAKALEVNEASLRRWIAGEVSAPLDILDRLPPTVAERLTLLAIARVRVRTAKRVTPADMMRALDVSIATLTLARAEGQDTRPALLKVSDFAAQLAARGLNDR